MNCLDEERLFALVEGAASKKDSQRWEQHIDGCERCKKALETMQKSLLAIGEEEPLDVKAHADTVMASLGRKPASRSSNVWPIAASGLALAAALLIGIGIGRGTKPNDDGEFTARGGGAPSASGPSVNLKRDVAVDIMKSEDGGFTRLLEWDMATTKTVFAAEGRNLGTKNACVMVFVVDARRDIHWVYPAYTQPDSDPYSVQMEPTQDFKSLGPSVFFDDIAPGRATVVTMYTKEPMPVSVVEKAKGITPEALHRAFPDAEIRTRYVDVRVP